MTMFDHDYKKYPELTNTELQVLGFTSPHPQILEDFSATVVKVHDGDTVTLETDFRDFTFPLRLLGINAPELNEKGGHRSQVWLEAQILGERVNIMIDTQQRVGKWGRLLGMILYKGMNLSETAIINGMATPFEDRYEGQIPTMDRYLRGAG